METLDEVMESIIYPYGIQYTKAVSSKALYWSSFKLPYLKDSVAFSKNNGALCQQSWT